MAASKLNDFMTPYLTEKAAAAVADLQSQGMDFDLAILVIELTVPEEQIYDIPVYQEELDEAKRRTERD